MILTSYFGKRSLKTTGLTPVAISLIVPKSFRGKKYTALAPTWDMLKLAYENNYDQFIEMYREQILDWLNPVKVYEELDGSVLLTHNNLFPFSHRFIVAQWLEDATGNPVKEFGNKK